MLHWKDTGYGPGNGKKNKEKSSNFLEDIHRIEVWFRKSMMVTRYCTVYRSLANTNISFSKYVDIMTCEVASNLFAVIDAGVGTII